MIDTPIGNYNPDWTVLWKKNVEQSKLQTKTIWYWKSSVRKV